ncbi:hypothetical protein RRG08_052653 [Elysia crispata]|uniref:Uncharacterized protein n=1 Tax=Elysia crispata TaxID=231223 RepID=A0AAE0ZWW7_9GAST|nr:hypothetical protein RRG08_052653 [Elysia crispata]
MEQSWQYHSGCTVECGVIRHTSVEHSHGNIIVAVLWSVESYVTPMLVSGKAGPRSSAPVAQRERGSKLFYSIKDASLRGSRCKKVRKRAAHAQGK